jgi:hypothetical protein
LFLTYCAVSPNDADNCAKEDESNPATASATPALIAYDEDSTFPNTLSPGIVPLINEPPLPITTCPEVNPANLSWIVSSSIAIICPGNIWSSEPVAYTCTIGYLIPKLCTIVKSLTLLNDTVSVNDVSG